MSQPVAIFAKIPITEKSFKSYLKTAPVNRLATFIFETLNQPDKNFYVFRHLKKEEVLFAYFYFNYGSLSGLLDSPVMAALQTAATFSDLPDTGYIAGTHDALNFDQEDLEGILRVNNQQCTAEKDIPDTYWQQLTKDIEQQFFKKVKADFADEFYKGRIVDSAIVKKCKALMEKRRQEEVLNNLDSASFLKPLFFFDKYFFNGQYIYCPEGNAQIYKDPDPAQFRQTPYGGTDGRYLVTDGHMLETDVASFKRMQNTEYICYKSATGVYDDKLQLIPEADPATFKVIDGHHAVDANNIYFNHLIISKKEIGVYKFDARGYYWKCIILHGERAVYVGDEKIDVDAATFKILQFPRNIHYNYCLLAVAADKNGTMILYKPSPFTNPVQIIRNEDPEAFIEKTAAALNNKREEKNDPPKATENNQEYCDSFRKWMHAHFDSYYPLNKLTIAFYRSINNYMYACFQEQQYEAITDIYDKIKDYAWINPYIFHHTACTYVKLGNPEVAVAEVRKALVYGYEKINNLWPDRDLEPIWNHPQFVTLRKFNEDNPYTSVSVEMLEQIVQLKPGDYDTVEIMRQITNTMYFPDLPQIPDNVEDKQLAAWYARYKELLSRVYEDYFMKNMYLGREKLYRIYRNHTVLPPRIHAEMLIYTFKDAHMFGQSDESKLTDCLTIAKALRASLSRIIDKEKYDAALKELEQQSFLSYALHELKEN
ncbi:DKNYY domain-containing protein [Chitinophaga sp. 212800010-3]|uniref:DKNYY domain-containing protein n=1 Tax=unclassified Chitinophaga TaxID=2619133 RepID=UPI002DEFCA23|nr:DKNYY domain-containing protein [Chitinophaga sp. 212800010-3]